MKLSDLPTHEQVLAEHLDADPEYRREWERTALARAVAVKVIAYRAEHGLSQTALAKRLKMTQPAVARLESGEHNPAFPMLLRISEALGIELAIDISPDRPGAAADRQARPAQRPGVLRGQRLHRRRRGGLTEAPCRWGAGSRKNPHFSHMVS